MIGALDVCYGREGAEAACVLFDGWTAAAEASSRVVHLAEVAPYEPGAFYRRELPCLLAVLAAVGVPLDVVVIDGYVWLDAEARPGLGAHLHCALGASTPVVGVAKTTFAGSAFAEAVVRGKSTRPLYVTAAGVDARAAAGWIRSMHGAHRLPDLLKRADRLCRGAAGAPTNEE
jgi:deoxyribonuclease V